MARRVKLFQKDFTREVHSIRDEWNMFDSNLAEFKKNYKACIPPGVNEVKTLQVSAGVSQVKVRGELNQVRDLKVTEAGA